jgi:hypothetical protein
MPCLCVPRSLAWKRPGRLDRLVQPPGLGREAASLAREGSAGVDPAEVLQLVTHIDRSGEEAGGVGRSGLAMLRALGPAILGARRESTLVRAGSSVLPSRVFTWPCAVLAGIGVDCNTCWRRACVARAPAA